MSVINDHYDSNGSRGKMVVLEQNNVQADSNATDDEKPKVC